MADLTGKTLANGYPNLVTIGATTDDNPTTGTLENGKGNNLTSVTFDGAVVVNESGGNNDFRVEGDTDANLLFVDASTDRVGIGTNAPTVLLDIEDVQNAVVDLNTTTAGNNTTIRFQEGGSVKGTVGYEGTNNGLILTTGGFTAGNGIFIDDSQNVGIGTSSPDTTLHIRKDSSNSQLTIERSGTATGKFQIYTNTNSLFFYDQGQTSNRMMIDGSGNVGIGTTSPAKKLDVNGEIRASGGILFGTDTAAANTLDDYEEGTWTPVYSPQTGSFTTMTMDVLSATYTKIGRQVTVRTRLRTDSVDATGASGDLYLSGLPFTSAGSNNGFSAISVGFASDWSTAPDSGIVNDSSTEIRLRKTNATAESSVSDLTTGAVANQNQLYLTATYFV
jgi:hypothetical protein